MLDKDGFRKRTINDRYDLDISPSVNWVPNNYVDGNWIQSPSLMN